MLGKYDDARRLLVANEYSKAETQLRSASALFQKLAEEFPTLPEHRVNLAESQRMLADLFAYGRRYSEAEEAYAKTADLYDHLRAEFPESTDYRMLHSSAEAIRQATRGSRLWSSNPAQAAVALRRAIDLGTELSRTNPDDPAIRDQLARNHLDLANLLTEQPLQSAQEHYQMALVLHESLAPEFINEPRYEETAAGIRRRLQSLRGRDAKPIE